MEELLLDYLGGLQTWLVGFIPVFVKGLVIAFAGWFGARWSKSLIDRAAAHLGWAEILWRRHCHSGNPSRRRAAARSTIRPLMTPCPFGPPVTAFICVRRSLLERL